MFGLFGKSKNSKKPVSKKSSKQALTDAKLIVKSVNKEILECVWDLYSHIKKAHPEQYDDFDVNVYNSLVDTWQALEKLIVCKGRLDKFTFDDRYLLLALRDGHLSYSDVIHVLIDHHDDRQEAEYIFEQFPRLHKIIPKEYDNARQVIEVLLEITKDYQWQMEHFAMSHYGEIEDALGEDHAANEMYVLPN